MTCAFEARPVISASTRPRRSDDQRAQDALDYEALLDSVAGEPEAFERLFTRHASACLAVSTQILIDRDMAQDAVQEAYLELWRKAGTFDPTRSPIGAWLIMLTRRRAVDRVRLEQRRPKPTNVVPDLPGDFDLAEAATTTILGQQMVALLRRLPAGQQHCLVLAHWGGLTMTEIALHLAIPVGTVKSRMRVAVSTMRRLANEQATEVASSP